MKKSQLAIVKSQWLISLSGLSALNVVQCLLSVWSSFNHPLTPLLDWTGHMGLCSSIVRGYFSFLPQRFMFVLFILFIELNTSHGNSEENLFRVLFTQDKQTVKSFPQASNWGCAVTCSCGVWSQVRGRLMDRWSRSEDTPSFHYTSSSSSPDVYSSHVQTAVGGGGNTELWTRTAEPASSQTHKV